MNEHIANAKAINRAYVKLFAGSFAGEMSYTHDPLKLEAEMEITEVAYKDGQPFANFRFSFFKGGVKAGKKTGTGLLKSITSFASRSRGFIIHTGPSRKIQIYSTEDNSELFGNVYELRLNEFIPVGTIRLMRQ